MPLNKEFVGRDFPPSEPYEVGREKIREFADAIGDYAPAYRDVEAARALGYDDVIAPPTFLTTLMFRRPDRVVTDPALGLDYSRVVHGEQRYVHHRPVRAGDVLVARPTVTEIRDIGKHEKMTIQMEITTTDGEAVCTATSTLVSRGTAAPKEA
ncbi:MAG: MaoC family dehydratase N-terminal domain-containing protein [Actinomycetota bacterium]|nr:MaoC family dehydratase N-terminal domain-containing protein [Actinomycetota bacterium]